MSLFVKLLPEAEFEVAAAYAWYESQRPGLGIQFLPAFPRSMTL